MERVVTVVLSAFFTCLFLIILRIEDYFLSFFYFSTLFFFFAYRSLNGCSLFLVVAHVLAREYLVFGDFSFLLLIF